MPYPKSASLVHMFKIYDKRFVVDINSCIITMIDELAWNVIKYSTKVDNESQIIKELESKFSYQDIEESIKEMKGLEARGALFTEDPLSGYKGRRTPISTLCLNISQVCDLDCRYCFAEGGSYGKGSPLMSTEIACKAVDFLLQNSGGLKNLTICFFGGEPLLNISTIKEVVKYCRQQEERTGKGFMFSLTTNGTNLTSEIRDFLAKNSFSIIFSIDGPKSVQDLMRPFKNGTGSYDIVSHNLSDLVEESERSDLPFSIRATFTRQNPCIVEVASHLYDLGCRDISIEPAVLKHDVYEIRKSDLKRIKKEYSRFSKYYIDEIKKGHFFSFFHFKHVMDQTNIATRYLTQCGAGSGYLAVSSDGDIYPCHRFVGNDDFLMGDIFTGIKDQKISDMFLSAHVNNKKKCLRCWARYMCGGGCHAYAVDYNKDILEPYAIECELMKYRIKLGIYIYSEFIENFPEILSQYYIKSSKSRPYMTQQGESDPSSK